jgi:hypothetical protein
MPKYAHPMRFVASVYGIGKILAGQFFQEFLLVHPVLESLAPINENYRNFVGKLAPQSVVGFHVNFAPVKTTSALQLREFLFHDLAQVTPLAGIDNHFAK